MKIKFLSFAKDDFREATAYYRQIDEDLAVRFKNEMKVSIDRIIHFTKSYQIIEDNIRRCVMHVFPYAIYYILEDNIIYIYAVANHYKNFKIKETSCMNKH